MLCALACTNTLMCCKDTGVNVVLLGFILYFSFQRNIRLNPFHYYGFQGNITFFTIQVPPANFNFTVYISRSGNLATNFLGLLRFRSIAHTCTYILNYLYCYPRTDTSFCCYSGTDNTCCYHPRTDKVSHP